MKRQIERARDGRRRDDNHIALGAGATADAAAADAAAILTPCAVSCTRDVHSLLLSGLAAQVTSCIYVYT